MPFSNLHPTKSLLLKTAVDLLGKKKRHEISSDEILEISGVSKGSMYHHYKDLPALIEAAQVARYSMWIDMSIEQITTALRSVKTSEDLYNMLKLVTETTQSAERKSARAERAGTLADAHDNPEMSKSMGEETKRLTEALRDLTQEAINKGTFREDVDAKAFAVFIQSYTLGKIVDDFTDEPLGDQRWNDFIMKMLDTAFIKRN